MADAERVDGDDRPYSRLGTLLYSASARIKVSVASALSTSSVIAFKTVQLQSSRVLVFPTIQPAVSTSVLTSLTNQPRAVDASSVRSTKLAPCSGSTIGNDSHSRELRAAAQLKRNIV